MRPSKSNYLYRYCFVVALLAAAVFLTHANEDTTIQPQQQHQDNEEYEQSEQRQVSDQSHQFTESSGTAAESTAQTISLTNASALPQNILDEIEDSFFDSLSRDPSCDDEDCWAPPKSTVETEETDESLLLGEETCYLGSPDEMMAAEDKGGSSSASSDDTQQQCKEKKPVVDKHWGSDPNIIRMRDKLREAGSVARSRNKKGEEPGDFQSRPPLTKNRRPPVFLMPGLASTRLVAWKFKSCPQHPLLSDIKVQDNVWLNINLVFQMGTIEASCLKDCLSLGLNQTDTDDLETGCKLRPDEGLDAISSLSPGGIGSQLLVGGTNTGTSLSCI